ncbi:MAG: dockerin type I domain-containing protein [bacterium]|nr:dockerin type I domain-containing protein [bacterium]
MQIFEYLRLKKKALFILLGLSFSLVAIFAGTYYVVKMRQEAARSRAGGGVSLYLDPQSSTVNLNSDFILKVKVNPASEKVTAVDLRLDFDKDKIEIKKIETTPIFSSLFMAPVIDNNQGKATIVVGIGVEPPPPVPVVSIADVVIIKAKTKNVAGTAVIKVNRDSLAAAIGKNANVIETYGEASVVIVTPTPTPTNTPTPTPTTTPTPKPTNTPLPSPSGQATPTPTTTPTPKPTNTPTPKPTATPTSTPTPKPTNTPTPTPKPGDVNGDGAVNVIDIGILIDNYGSPPPPAYPRADQNGDKVVNVIDIGMVIDNYGR